MGRGPAGTAQLGFPPFTGQRLVHTQPLLLPALILPGRLLRGEHEQPGADAACAPGQQQQHGVSLSWAPECPRAAAERLKAKFKCWHKKGEF